MRPEPRLLSGFLLSVLMLSGCILWPPFGVPGTEETIVIENRSDQELVVRFSDPDLYAQSYAVPPETIGEAVLFTAGESVTVELTDPDCEPITELSAEMPVGYIVIGDDLALSVSEEAPPEPDRLLSDYFDCDVFGSDPALDDVDLAALPAGRLVVSGGPDGDLWAVSLPDGGLHQLTSGAESDLSGDVAHDGSIAFSRFDPSAVAGELWLLEPGPTEPRLLREQASAAVWAPDGIRLAVADGDPFGGGLVVIDSTGERDDVRVTSDVVTTFAWDPAGERLAFLAAGALDPFAPTADSRIMVATPGERPTVLAQLPAFGSMAWSPDGSRLAVETFSATGSGVAVIDTATGDELFVIDAGSTFTAAPSWSPDGERLVFLRSDGFDLSTTLMAVAADGGDPVELGDLGDLAAAGPVAWSPDGSHVAVAGSGMTVAGELWLVPADGGDPVRLLTGANTLLGWR